ncbi:hypothetical protein XU18_4001 [Perkinsela sp. CCAP 1560/4]|nr:hypothetical protein XU18_4001 [Perkinsela sp. CCAP 1560/4]|eukprot:KNH04813.1 hypothetical protein XU18_4001 [Perkinsela sp. CCAP 1560/4]
MHRSPLSLDAKLNPLHVFIDEKFNEELAKRSLATGGTNLRRKFRLSQKITKELTEDYTHAISIVKYDCTQKCTVLEQILRNRSELAASAFPVSDILPDDFARSRIAITRMRKSNEGQVAEEHSVSDPPAIQDAVYSEEQMRMCAGLLADADFHAFLSNLERKTLLSPKGLGIFLKNIIEYKRLEKSRLKLRSAEKKPKIMQSLVPPGQNAHKQALQHPHLSEPALKQKLRLMKLKNSHKQIGRG